MIRKLTFILLGISSYLIGISQGIRLENDIKGERLMNIIDVSQMPKSPQFTSIKFTDSRSLCDTLMKNYNSLSDKDQFEASYFINQYNYFYPDLQTNGSVQSVDSNFYSYSNESSNSNIIKFREPVLKYFYSNPHHFYSFQSRNFSIHIDPIVNLSLGHDKASDSNFFQNTRGARVSGYIDKKVYFFSQILENQTIFPAYVNEYIKDNQAIPGNGFYKPFNSKVVKSIDGWDYLNASGYMGFNVSKSVSLDFGHGRHFIGNGIRSLLLSDFANNYFYLKLNTKVWIFQYQNIFAELSAYSHRNQSGDVLIPKKYFATHYLSLKPLPQLEIGLFESVIFSRENHFELQYLNPIIFYRSIEQALGSPDNAMLGLNANVNLFKTAKVYGQVVVDEFKLNELGTGWFGNKVGFQLGGSYYNAFNVKGFDIKVESNIVRPFTYAQSRPIPTFPQYSITSYSHGNQALAHPLGANFKEYILKLSYQLNPKIYSELTYINYSKGRDDVDQNNGGNILLNTDTAISMKVYGYNIGDGLKDKVNYLNWLVSYEIMPNLNIDLNSVYRHSTLSKSIGKKELFSGNLGIRYNITPTKFEF